MYNNNGDTTSASRSIIEQKVNDIKRINDNMDTLIVESNQRMKCTLDTNSGQYVSALDPVWAQLVNQFNVQRDNIYEQARLLGVNVEELSATEQRSAREAEESVRL